MPKNSKKKRNAKNKGNTKEVPLQLKTEFQEYAEVRKLLGDCHVLVYSYEGKEYRGRIRGSLRKKCRIVVGDHVLIALREFSDKGVDIVHKYSSEEVRKLSKMGELVDMGKLKERADEDDGKSSREEEIGFEFDEI